MATHSSKTERLPEWLASQQAVDDGDATALQRFIAEHEPAAAELRDLFRTELAAVLAEAALPTSCSRPAEASGTGSPAI